MAKEYLKIPPFIDLHQHHRFGQPNKQDWQSATKANLAGGIALGMSMPNDKELITTLPQLKSKSLNAQQKIYSDIGIYLGTLGKENQNFNECLPFVWGLKVFMDLTTGGHIVSESGKVI